MSTSRVPPQPSFAPLLRTFGLWFLLWASLVKFPDLPSPQLDTSWQITLGYAATHHLAFGRDLLFTYGPLGYLASPVNIGEHYGAFVLWQVGIHGLIAGILLVIGERLRPWRRFAYYAFFLLLGTLWADQVYIFVIAMLGLVLLWPEIERRRALAVGIPALIGILALTKFVNLTFGTTVIVCAAGYFQFTAQRKLSLTTLVSFAGAVLVTWLSCQQHLADFPRYFMGSIRLTAGYSEAMAIDQSGGLLCLGLLPLLCLGVYLFISVRRSEDLPRALAGTAIAAATLFLNWKHGFVRPDFHATSLFFTGLLFVVTHPVLLRNENGAPRAKQGWLLLAAVPCIAGIYTISPPTVTRALAAWNFRIEKVVHALLSPAGTSAALRTQVEAAREKYALPAIRPLVGSNSVDVVGSEQGYAVLNGFHFQPRPVFQSYSAYTEALMKLNERRYQSPEAPAFVLQKLQTIDERFPGGDDSLTTRYLYHHYSWITEDSGFQVWQRNAIDPALDASTALSTSTVTFGQTIEVPARGDNPVWVELDIRLSWLGRVRAFLYKPPLLHLRVTDAAGAKSYRLVRGIAQAGFLAYPFFKEDSDIGVFEGGAETRRIKSLAVEVSPGGKRFYDSSIAVKFSSLPPFPRSAGNPVPGANLKFGRPFHPIVAAKSYAPLSQIEEAGEKSVLTHPPSSLEFLVDRTHHRLRGRFGITASAYTAPNATDGVAFSVQWVPTGAEPQILFQRMLRPTSVVADRGSQALDVAIPAGEGRLVLTTDPGPAGNLSFDWSYWGQLRFEP